MSRDSLRGINVTFIMDGDIRLIDINVLETIK